MSYPPTPSTRHRAARHSRALRKLARQLLAVAMAASLVFIGWWNTAEAELCDRDPTFGHGGKVIADFNDYNSAVGDLLLQPDGKLIATGGGSPNGNMDFALWRFNSDGSPDDGTVRDSTPNDSFGTGGRVHTDFFGFNDGVEHAILQSDGKILVAGTAFTATSYYHQAFALARYNSDGTPDQSFGTGGKVAVNFSGHGDWLTKIFPQPDGKLLAAGTVHIPGDDSPYPPITIYLLLARFNNDGSLDDGSANDSTPGDSFGNAGRIIPDRPLTGAISDFAMQPDGKFVTVGTGVSPGGSGYYGFLVTRYNANGSLDDGSASDATPGDSFGTGGLAYTSFDNGHDYANVVALQPNGKIVVGGQISHDPGYDDFALVRYNPDGQLDQSFGSGGKTITDFQGLNDGIANMIFQPDGKIIAAGWADDPRPESGSGMFGVARYSSDGKLDRSFGRGGKLTTIFGASTATISALVLQPDGKLVVGGTLYDTNPLINLDIALVRYATNASCPPSPLTLSLSSYSVPGSQTVQGTVTLTEAAPPEGALVILSSTNDAASVPASIKIAPGATTRHFNIKTTPVATVQAGYIIAKLGTTNKSAPFVVQPPGVSSLSLNPNIVEGPRQVTGVVTLNAPAPAGGMIVHLASRNPRIASLLSDSIIIPGGARVKSFTVRVADVPSARTAIITATANGVSKSAVLSIH